MKLTINTITNKCREEWNDMTDNSNRLGVYVLVSHLIVTLAFIALYGINIAMGKDVGTLEAILLVIVGHWFGAITKDSLKSAEKISTTAEKTIVQQETITDTNKEDSNGTIK